MPVSPAPDFVTLRYKKVVGLGLAFQAINFAQGEFMGHRVRFNVPVDYMNQYFFWERASGDYRPTGRFMDDGHPLFPGQEAAEIDELPPFVQFLEWSLGTRYTDVDAVADGLNYSSEALDTYNDSKRDIDVYNFVTPDELEDDPTEGTVDPVTHYGANDLVMAYVLYKCFGSSAFDAQDIVYNLEDAFGMLTSKALAEAVRDSLEAEDTLATTILAATAEPKPGQRGKVDDMFRALLATDPKRFFLKGKQIEGLFETNYLVGNEDASGSDPEAFGNWCLKPGDIIEIPIKLVFTAPVTVLSVVDNAKEPSSLSPEQPETVVIKGQDPLVAAIPASGSGTSLVPAVPAVPWAATDAALATANRANIMSIRLQLLCSAPLNTDLRTFATSELLEDDAVVPVSLKIANQMNLIFYNSSYYPAQSAIAVVPVGGTGTYAYACADLPVGVTLDATSGVLTFNRMTTPLSPALPEPVTGIVNGRHPVAIAVTSGGTTVTADIFVTVSDGTEATNVVAPAGSG